MVTYRIEVTMFDIIKAQMTRNVPFAATAGVEIDRLDHGTATAALVQRPDLSNHVGSVHAGALFTLGETASGAAMSGAFASQIMTIRPIATGATIAYVKIAKGRIEATATTQVPASELLAKLDADGRVKFDIDVTLVDEANVTVATMVVSWLVSKR
jgi:acyl-coenzyme A thioesterase PaaI-like protein